MGKKINASLPSLSGADAAIVKGMLARGDRQHDIAAWFGVNSGRIAEVANGSRFCWIVAAEPSALPPVGPYPGASALAIAVNALHEARSTLRAAEAAIQFSR